MKSATEPFKRFLGQLSRPAMGLGFCVIAAMAAVFTCAHHPWRVFVPLAFVVVIVLLSLRFGVLVGVFGSIATALIFAYFLFPPLGSVRVTDSSARANLAWMLLGSLVISFLATPEPHNRQRK